MKNSRLTKEAVALLLVLLLTVGFGEWLAASSQQQTHNYLFPGQTSLDQHLVKTRLATDFPVVLLGSSTFAGSLVPENSTISDFWNQRSPDPSLNLATFEASILDSLVIFLLAAEAKPKIVILDIDPTSFPSRFDSEWLRRYGILLSTACPDLALEHTIHTQSRFRFDHWSWPSGKIPSPLLFRLWSTIENWRAELYGPVYSKDLNGKYTPSLATVLDPQYGLEKYLQCYSKLVQQRGAKAVLVMGPIYKYEKTYNPVEFRQYKSRVLAAAKSSGIQVLEYTEFLANSPVNFTDYLHLTVNGNSALVDQMFHDLYQRRQ